MNDPRMEAIWEQVLARIKNKINQTSFDIWLGETKPLACHEHTLYLEIPDEFTRDWVETRYIPLIKEIIAEESGCEWEIKLLYAREREELLAKIPPMSQENTINSCPLNPKYTFETFVVGNNNRFVHAASLAVAEAPGKAYNPLFIYGGVGLGKTHLMHAIGHAVRQKGVAARVAYVSSEQFTNNLINSIRDDRMEEFRNTYRTVDLLLVDDIQFLEGKERTQEEFFHTFNTLHGANKQIVISSDRPPRDIATLEDRLRSRFEWGLIADIQPPDLETRIAILKKKAEIEQLEIANEVLLFIANQFTSNIRELEGALIRVTAHCGLKGIPITLENAQHVLQDILPTTKQKIISLEVIQKGVCEYFGLQIEDLKAKKRTRAVAYPRQIAMYLARDLAGESLPRIGEAFGGRDHTTVLHAYEKIKEEMESNPTLARQIQEISERLQTL